MKSNLFIMLWILMSAGIALANKTLCDGTDDRILWAESRIARTHDGFLGKHGCTATLFSDRCLITAGHCENYLKVVEFRVPLSNEDGSINHSNEQDIFFIDPESISLGHGSSNDWAVMKALKNSSGQYPGEIYGYFNIGYSARLNQPVTISGYGQSKIREYNNVLKNSSGVIGKIENARLYYRVDTMSGDSGASIINEANQIIGVHTTGGCNNNYNKGVFIVANEELKAAISKCLSE